MHKKPPGLYFEVRLYRCINKGENKHEHVDLYKQEHEALDPGYMIDRARYHGHKVADIVRKELEKECEEYGSHEFNDGSHTHPNCIHCGAEYDGPDDYDLEDV